MCVIGLSKSINRNLIRIFDHSRIRYMFLVFPTYQILAFLGIAAIAFSFESVNTAFYFGPMGLILALFIGVPLIASWHLSCLLFMIGYFEFFAWIGVPFMAWAAKLLEGPVNWLRPPL